MKKLIKTLFIAFFAASFAACGGDDPKQPDAPKPEEPEVPEVSEGGKTLVAYFSWGGTTRRMARQISALTDATLFEIVPENPYPAEYTPCTEVALEEKNNNARPAIINNVGNWDDYEVVFIGCPVWWWTTPMIIHTFAESYDFTGKTVVPFCTYASTYRDETLAEIVNITPGASHLPGLGLTGGQISEDRIKNWLTEIKILK